MPTGKTNRYNYLVITQGEQWKFKERQDIIDAFGMSLSTIRNILKEKHQIKPRKKYSDFKIYKLNKNKITVNPINGA